MFEYKQFYKRKLPHRHSPGRTIFVTFRLHGSIPGSVLKMWKAERKALDYTLRKSSSNPDTEYKEKLLLFRRKWFARFEEILHKAASGPVWLKDPAVAAIVSECLYYLDGRAYRLHAFCIMSNHVHVLFTPLLDESSLRETTQDGRLAFESSDPTLAAIMKSIKGYSARKANEVLGRKGRLWEPESYDRQVRNEDEFWRIVKYIVNNPVKAGIVTNWQEFPYTWTAEGIAGSFRM